MEPDGRFDNVLMSVTQACGGIGPLLHEFFSFLHRRTDFYVVDPSPRRPMGFAEGDAKTLLLKSFLRFPFKHVPAAPSSPGQGGEPLKAASAKPAASKPAAKASPPSRAVADAPQAVSPPVASKASTSASSAGGSVGGSTGAVGVGAAGAGAGAAGHAGAAAAGAGAGPTAARAGDAIEGPGGGDRGGGGVGGSVGDVAAAQPPSSTGSKGVAEESRLRYTADGKQVPISNGGVGPNYWWTQTLQEATVYMDLPSGATSRDVNMELTPSTVSLSVRGRPEPLLVGELGGTVRQGESLWEVEDGRLLVITLDKALHVWWRSVVKGHPEIDATQVDSTMRVEEYDEETQAAIRKIMFDQTQKAQGLPTSDELAAEALVEKARLAPGSPFA